MEGDYGELFLRIPESRGDGFSRTPECPLIEFFEVTSFGYEGICERQKVFTLMAEDLRREVRGLVEQVYLAVHRALNPKSQ